MSSDAAARTAALDPRRSFIVQAPAGSGKTELLAQRYLRLLATVEAPEQILAITFTRKAAAEMRQRILLAFAAAGESAPASPHKRTTWELACAVRDADLKHGWHLAQHPSRLRIQTIDALNASLARRLPMLAATGAALQPTSDAKPLYEAACRGLIERLGDGSEAAANLEALIVHLGNRVDRLAELLGGLLAKRDQWLHPIVHARASENLRAVLEETLHALVNRHLRELYDSLRSDRANELLALVQYSAGNLLAGAAPAPARRAVLESCVSWSGALGTGGECLPVWRAIAAMLFKQDGDLYEKVDVRQGFPKTQREPKERMQALLRSLAAEPALGEQLAALPDLPDVAYAADQWRIVEALLQVLPEAVAELQLVFQSHGEADYVEIALRALRALGTPEDPTDLALAFDYRLQHILVDEFQDTSFAQLDLLERLTGGWSEGDGRTLFCVGDPMQSIYRFRQAEVGLFLELQSQGLRNIRLEPLRLTANFRSAAPIVDWINRVFPHVLAAQNDPEQGAVRYSPSIASVTDRQGAVRVHPAVNGDDLAEGARVASIVREALLQDDDGSIAILVPTRTRVDAIARSLASAGIGFDAVEIEQLRERPVVQDLIALTRALVHLADRTAWLAVLRAPWCGLLLADLHALAAEDPRLTVDELLTTKLGKLSIDGQARALRVHGVLGKALTERGRWPLRAWVERTWNALGGPATVLREQDLDDAEAFLRRLEEIETAGDLAEVTRLEAQLERLFARPRTRAGSRVELMTIHAAKGLEFDTVILPGLQRWTRPEDRELLRWTRIVGPAGGMVLAPIKAQGAQADSIYRWIELLERQRVLRERARLLYVAVTRAKRELHLLGSVEVKSGAGELAEPRKGSMLRLLWHAVAADFEAVAPESSSPARRASLPPQQLRRLPAGWTLPAIQPALSTRLVPLVDISPPVPFDWVTQTSRRVGTLVHRELDRMSRAQATPAPGMLAAARTRLAAELAELGVPVDRCDTACERVIAAIEQALGDPRGRWLLGLDKRIRDAQSELALSGVIDGRVIEGVIDRTFVDEQGKRWVVDFKTSTHEGGGLEAFLAAETERYRPQLQRYVQLMALLKPREEIHAALYFPLLRAWREVDVGKVSAIAERGAAKNSEQMRLF